MDGRGGSGRAGIVKPFLDSKFREPYLSMVLDKVRKGVTLKTAAMAAGISYQTLLNWRKRGEEEAATIYRDLGPDEYPEGSYAAFVVALWKAESEFVTGSYDAIGEICRGGALVKRVIKRGKDGAEIEEEQYSAPTWQGIAWQVERSKREYQLASKEESSTPQIQIVFTNDWRNVNAMAGRIIDADTIEGEVVSEGLKELADASEDSPVAIGDS